ncbi:MAG: oligosaccharide flippase family protein [Solirubrobacteraceae bacterium]|nr:oligosaccharide flippase family protein [Solirubrobacteraceae bacterium]
MPVHPARWRGRSSPQVAGLAVASLTANALALIFTIVFARVLGEEEYGSLAVVTSWLLILGVPGSALQVAAARDVAAGRYGEGPALAAVARRWLRPVMVAAVVLAAVCAIAREQLGAITGVDEVWAAALIVPGACAWFALCLLRGVLQGDGAIGAVAWSIVGEATGRVICGLVLLLAGAGVVGAFAGTPLSFAIAASALYVVLRRRVGAPGDRLAAPGLAHLATGAWSAIIALTLLMVLQSLDVIVVKHRFEDDAAGSYTAAAVAAKVLIWVAIGLAVYVVPEASRRAARGAAPFGALANALAAIALLAVPVLAIFLFAPETLMRLGFGEEYADAATALLPLGTAMTLLACCYLASQYLLALRHWTFLVVLSLAVLVEFAGLLTYGDGYRSVGIAVLASQLICVSALLAIAARAEPRGVVAEVPV